MILATVRPGRVRHLRPGSLAAAVVLGAIFAWMAVDALALDSRSSAGGGAVPLLAALPGAPLRRDGGGLGARVTDALAQEAVEMTPGLWWRASFLGWALIVAALLIYGLTFVVALAYLQFD